MGRTRQSRQNCRSPGFVLKRRTSAWPVMGVQDEQKASARLLSAVDIDLAELRSKLHGAAGKPVDFPNRSSALKQFPVLGPGKLDLKKCMDSSRKK